MQILNVKISMKPFPILHFTILEEENAKDLAI